MFKYKKILSLTLLLLFMLPGVFAQNYTKKTAKDTNGYTYQYYSNDPLNTVVYTLHNGLKIYFSPGDEDTRIQTMFGVRAGSSLEPLESTGLAHYLEHMLFKGTSKIGTVNWDAEKPLLDEISLLYQTHRNEPDTDKKKAIYAKIDSVSFIAAQYAAPNEYSKLTTGMGAKYENAATSMDFTFYRQNIPSNQLERWAMLESERMFNIALRLFHTELETVYEEFNRAQDNDGRKIFYAMLDNLFEVHPYKRPVIGNPFDLKNPSMENIHTFFNTYYVPNNMFIVLSGNVNPEEAMPLLQKYFGKKESKPLPSVILPKEKKMLQHKEVDLFSDEEEKVFITYRFNGKKTDDYKHVYMISNLLHNGGKVGLLNKLNHDGACFGAGSSSSFFKDYGIHYVTAQPTKDQSLEELKELLQAQIERIIAGDFDEWQIQAIVNDLKVKRADALENNISRAGAILYAELYGVPYEDYLRFPEELEMLTKKDIMDFARNNYRENYVLINKRKGEKELLRVEKPDITPLELNKENQSDFADKFLAITPKALEPLFIDYKLELPEHRFSNGMGFYILPKESDLFALRYIIPAGKKNDYYLPFALRYMQELGTSDYTPTQLKEEFFKYGITFNVSAAGNKSYINISGLDEHLEKAVALIDHLFDDAQNDAKVFERLIDKQEKSQSLMAKDKRSVQMYGRQYLLFGPDNYFTYEPSLEQLENSDPEKLLDKAKSLFDFKHDIYYSGKRGKDEVMELMATSHRLGKSFATPAQAIEFAYAPADKPMVYLFDFDMVQAQVSILARDVDYSPELDAYKELYDEYYGTGLASVVFREIREARALAYSSGSYYVNDVASDESNYVVGYLGTQTEKLPEAVDALAGLMDSIHFDASKFNIARQSLIKSIESERIPRKYYFGRYMNYLDKGIDYDVRKRKYEQLKTMTEEQFKAFFHNHIRHANKQYFIMGKKSELDLDALQKIGEVRELTTKDIFGF